MEREGINDSEEENQNIIVQKIEECIHNTINLDFIRSLNMEDASEIIIKKNKDPYIKNHCHDIISFI